MTSKIVPRERLFTKKRRKDIKKEKQVRHVKTESGWGMENKSEGILVWNAKLKLK